MHRRALRDPEPTSGDRRRSVAGHNACGVRRSVVNAESRRPFLAPLLKRSIDRPQLLRGDGRFTGHNGAVVKEEPFVVILLHAYDDFRANDRKIEQIRRTYKTRFHQESVLRLDYQFSVRVSF
jgi:Protein of unknown function (DUF3574)